MMHRNLDRRVETLVRLRAQDHLAEMQKLFELAMSPTASAWNLGPDGNWMRNGVADSQQKFFDLQDQIMRRTLQARSGAN
jgi:polyphosphate kinase